MSVFSSTQPSLRARLLPKFPARVLAGNGITITKSGLTYTFAVNGEISFDKLTLASLVNAGSDSAAATAGVGLNEVYRNGSQLMVRVA